MKPRIVSSFVLVLVLASAILSPVRAQPDQPDTVPPSVYAAAKAPWSVESVQAAAGSDVGAGVSSVMAGGTLWISYYDATNMKLRVAHMVSAGGNCGPGLLYFCETISDPAADYGRYSSIAYYPGNGAPFSWKIGLAYYETSTNTLKYTMYSCYILGCVWAPAQTVFQLGGQYVALKFDSTGTPLVAFYIPSHLIPGPFSYQSGSMMVASYSGGAGGNCITGGAWNCNTVEPGSLGITSAPGNGMYLSMDIALFADKPFISYYDAANHTLKVAYKASGGGNCGAYFDWNCITVDTKIGEDLGLYTSLAVRQSNGYPFIAYYNATRGELWSAQYVGLGGNCPATTLFNCYKVTSIGSLGGPAVGTSIAFDQVNYPVIAYEDGSDALAPTTIGVARPVQPLGLAAGNCGPLSAGSFSWECKTIVSGGNSYLDEGDALSLTVNPAGLLFIAFHESDSYPMPNDGYLKVAHQGLPVYLPALLR